MFRLLHVSMLLVCMSLVHLYYSILQPTTFQLLKTSYYKASNNCIRHFLAQSHEL